MLGDGWLVEVGERSLGVTGIARSDPAASVGRRSPLHLEFKRLQPTPWKTFRPRVGERERLSESLDQTAQEEYKTEAAYRS